MFRLFFKIILTATFGFALLGLAVVIGSAVLEGVGETEMEDGRTIKEHMVENKQKLKDAYGPCFEGVDGKKVFKEDMKELHDLGKETFDTAKTKAKETIEYLQEVKEYMEEE